MYKIIIHKDKECTGHTVAEYKCPFEVGAVLQRLVRDFEFEWVQIGANGELATLAKDDYGVYFGYAEKKVGYSFSGGDGWNAVDPCGIIREVSGMNQAKYDYTFRYER